MRALIAIVLFAAIPMPAEATPGWCFPNVDGQQVCGATFEESVALLLADTAERDRRLFAQRAADEAARQAAQQAEWKRQAEEQAAREAEWIRISLENATKNKAEEEARLAAQQQPSSQPQAPAPSDPAPSAPTPPSNPTPPSDPSPPPPPPAPSAPAPGVAGMPTPVAPEIVDCARPEYFEHPNCGGPRSARATVTQPEPRIEPVRSEAPLTGVLPTQSAESSTATAERVEELKVAEPKPVVEIAKVNQIKATPIKPVVTQAPKDITPVATVKKIAPQVVSTKKTAVVKKISCIKGKSVKVVSGINPTCPPGYKAA